MQHQTLNDLLMCLLMVITISDKLTGVEVWYDRCNTSHISQHHFPLSNFGRLGLIALIKCLIAFRPQPQRLGAYRFGVSVRLSVRPSVRPSVRLSSILFQAVSL